MEELGFGYPIRFIYVLRARTTETIAGTTIHKLHDHSEEFLTPSHWHRTPYVNGVRYGYQIQEFQNPNYADATEVVLLIQMASPMRACPVASGIFGSGMFCRRSEPRRCWEGFASCITQTTTLWRDCCQQLLPEARLGEYASWIPFLGLTNVATNNVGRDEYSGNESCLIGLRGGINKLKFQRVFFDAILGQSFTAGH
jgi:hypothetical protein